MPHQRRFTSSRIPAQKLADKISTKCEAKNRINVILGQIKTQESIIRQANVAILKYKKELRLIEEKVSNLPATKRGFTKQSEPGAQKEPYNNVRELSDRSKAMPEICAVLI